VAGPERAFTDSPCKIGDAVVFHIRDVFVPCPADLLQLLKPDDDVVGALVDLSDSGQAPDAFGVVELADHRRGGKE
jgi:hypothetical protein